MLLGSRSGCAFSFCPAGDFLFRIQVPHGHGAHEFYHVAGFSCGSSLERLYRNDKGGHAISLYSPSTTTGCIIPM